MVTGPGAVIDLAQGTGQTDLVLEIGQTDLAQGTGRIDQTDPGLEIVQATGLLLEVEIVQALDQVRDKDPVLEQGQVQGQVQEQGQVRVQARVQDRVLERDQVHAQVQWIGQGQGQVRDKVVPEPVVEVPLVATRTGALLPGTVNAVAPVVPANQEQDRQGVLRAGAEVEADQRAEVVDVAEAVVVAVVVVDVGADLKWP